MGIESVLVGGEPGKVGGNRRRGKCENHTSPRAARCWRYAGAIILFGVTAGQAVLATTTQVYLLFFLQRVLKVPADDSYWIVAGALLLVMPLFPALGALSDRIGRNP
jgi:MFS family permease